MGTLTHVSAQTVCPNYVNGRWAPSGSQRMLERRNPARWSDVLGSAPLSTRSEVREAIDAAAQTLSAWRDTPAPARGKILLRFARLLEEHKDDSARLLTREEGKTLAESAGEIARTVNIVEYIAGEGRRLAGETLPSELHRNFAYTIRQALGVVGLITPWNFPVAVPVWKIAPALVCGNTLIWKPSELTPFTSQRVVELFEAAGLPPGVLNLVHGAGEEVGDEIVQHPGVKAISFTGSCEVGSLIYGKAARQMKKVQCEMGGKNPVLVLEDADLELAAASTVQGAFGSTGQRCTATSRVIVARPIADEFVRKLTLRAGRMKVGDGARPGVEVGPSVDEAQFKKVLEYIEIGEREAQLACGGRALTSQDGSEYGEGYFIAPTIFDHVSPEARIAQEEIFGPVLSVIRVKDFEEALSVANSTRFGLTASIFTSDASRVFEAAERLECGMVHVNSPTVGGEAQVPFGGVKATGIGERETGSTAIEFYSELKVVYVDYSARSRESKVY